MPKSFLHTGYFNGFVKRVMVPLSRWNETSSGDVLFLGPFTLQEAARIVWRLKEINFNIRLETRHTYEGTDMPDRVITTIKSPMESPEYTEDENGGYTERKRVVQEGDLSVEPRMRYLIDMCVNQTGVSGNTEKLFSLFGLLIDDEKFQITNHALRTEAMYYFICEFSGGDDEIYIKECTEKSASSGSSWDKIIRLPIFDRTLNLGVKYRYNSESVKHSVDISVKTVFYEDGDFA